jgi:hypothetical protein
MRRANAPQGELNSWNDGRNVGGQASWQDDDELRQQVEAALPRLHAAVLHQPVDGLHDARNLATGMTRWRKISSFGKF